jgi:hypothetical protein
LSSNIRFFRIINFVKHLSPRYASILVSMCLVWCQGRMRQKQHRSLYFFGTAATKNWPSVHLGTAWLSSKQYKKYSHSFHPYFLVRPTKHTVSLCKRSLRSQTHAPTGLGLGTQYGCEDDDAEKSPPSIEHTYIVQLRCHHPWIQSVALLGRASLRCALGRADDGWYDMELWKARQRPRHTIQVHACLPLTRQAYHHHLCRCKSRMHVWLARHHRPAFVHAPYPPHDLGSSRL